MAIMDHTACTRSRLIALACLAVVPSALGGCSSRESHFVEISYTLEPSKALPPGLTSIAVLPAELGPATDPKWSQLASNVVINLLHEANAHSDVELTVVAREETKKLVAEADLAAAGLIQSDRPGADPVLHEIEGIVVSRIDVKVETHRGRERTIDSINLSALTGNKKHHRGPLFHTSEVPTVSRTMTVHSSFKLIDAKTGKEWESSVSRHQGTDETRVSPFFGSGKTEADLTPRDRIIGTLVERGAREFVGKLVPRVVRQGIRLKSSSHDDCEAGVRLLRADMYENALARFRATLADDPEDHRALFAAGVACELTGRYDEALRYYRLACAEDDKDEYLENKQRLAAHLDRIRRE